MGDINAIMHSKKGAMRPNLYTFELKTSFHEVLWDIKDMPAK
jgi:hypothetical protein